MILKATRKKTNFKKVMLRSKYAESGKLKKCVRYQSKKWTMILSLCALKFYFDSDPPEVSEINISQTSKELQFASDRSGWL